MVYLILYFKHSDDKPKVTLDKKKETPKENTTINDFANNDSKNDNNLKNVIDTKYNKETKDIIVLLDNKNTKNLNEKHSESFITPKNNNKDLGNMPFKSHFAILETKKEKAEKTNSPLNFTPKGDSNQSQNEKLLHKNSPLKINNNKSKSSTILSSTMNTSKEALSPKIQKFQNDKINNKVFLIESSIELSLLPNNEKMINENINDNDVLFEENPDFIMSNLNDLFSTYSSKMKPKDSIMLKKIINFLQSNCSENS